MFGVRMFVVFRLIFRQVLLEIQNNTAKPLEEPSWFALAGWSWVFVISFVMIHLHKSSRSRRKPLITDHGLSSIRQLFLPLTTHTVSQGRNHDLNLAK